MKNLIIILGLVLSTGMAKAQDVHFSQFWNNSISYNPGLAGTMAGNMRIIGNYRNQWFTAASPYQTFGVNFDMLLEGKGNTNFGIGAVLFRDVAGDTKMGTTNIQAVFSTIIDLDLHSKLSLGLKGGMIQRGFSTSAARWNSQYQNGSFDPTLGSGENVNTDAGTRGDVSFGMAYVYHSSINKITNEDAFQAKVGFSYNHILRPRFEWFGFSDEPSYSNFVLNAEFIIGLEGSKWSLLPGFIAQFQGPSREFIIGSQYRVSLRSGSKITGFKKGAHLILGTHLRWKDAFIPSVGVEINDYSFGVSYDANFSQLRTASKGIGGIEFTFKFNTASDYLWKNYRYKSRI